MRKLSVIGSFIVIATAASPAWADVAPPPQDPPPPSDPQPPTPPPVAEQPPAEPPADEKKADDKVAEKADEKKSDDKKADDKKSGSCSITDDNNAMLGLAALALLLSGVALRRRD
jgi:hypothetical protein